MLLTSGGLLTQAMVGKIGKGYPPKKITCPTFGKGKSCLKAFWEGIFLVLRRVVEILYGILYHPSLKVFGLDLGKLEKEIDVKP